MTIRQYAYQHAGPSRGLSVEIFATRTVRGDFRHEDCPPVRISARWPFPWTIRGDFRHEDCPRVIFATRTVRGTVRQDAYQHAGPSRGLSGDFRHEDCPPVRISARWPFPWTIRGDFRHEDCPRDCPRVIFATRTVRQHAYQHAGPSRGLSGDFRHEDCPPVRISARWPFPWTIRGDFRHEDCPWVIFATRTVRGDFRHEDCPPVRISARWPFPWTIRGDFRHEECPWDCPWVIFATRTVRQTHNSTLTLPVDCPVLFPRGQYISTHIGTLALPVDCSGDFRHEDCPPSDSPCPHFSSELAVRRPGKLPKSRSQSAPADTRRSARHVSAQAARQQSTGSNWDPEPSPQSQSFSGYGSILPTSLPTLFHRPEAVHLGDLMRYEYDRRERTRSSGFSRAGMHRHHATRRCSSSR
ncbi:hypothetical protein Bca4012_102761 [Brassica carinata]